MRKVNIIIPVYNEALRIEDTLNSLLTYLKKATQLDIYTYFVDDGSKDKSNEIITAFINGNNLNGTCLSYKVNKGKGHAVNFGMLNSRAADLYYMADADSSASWSVLDQLLSAKDASNANCVIGSRAISTSKVTTSFSKKILSKFSNLIISTLLGLNFKDTQCGYKLFDKNCLEAFKRQTLDTFGFDFEILYILRKLNLKVVEEGIEWKNKENSKVKFKHYLQTLSELFKVRFTKYII